MGMFFQVHAWFFISNFCTCYEVSCSQLRLASFAESVLRIGGLSLVP